jgi:2-methylisocitrate lyase-like PEP mutase family enzyme
MPNPWDIGSAVHLEAMGFKALATTSSGHAASLGRQDQEIRFDELRDHVAALTAAVRIPLNVDAERLFGETPDECAEHLVGLAECGAAGVSIEDYNPTTSTIEPLAEFVQKVAACSAAAAKLGVVLTARAENHLYGIDDVTDTIVRLQAFRTAGAHVVYAPGLVAAEDIVRVVDEVGGAVNVLLRESGPSVSELADLGVRRASTGGRLASVAYRAMQRSASELLT